MREELVFTFCDRNRKLLASYVRFTKIQDTTRLDSVWHEAWSRLSKKQQLQEVEHIEKEQILLQAEP